MRRRKTSENLLQGDTLEEIHPRILLPVLELAMELEVFWEIMLFFQIHHKIQENRELSYATSQAPPQD